ncbi:hypothetical protein K3495_g2456 [Podosphaera aphanis]|nr:hypothetical protein K3495_g2456 [Podosphaera aphanis]
MDSPNVFTRGGIRRRRANGTGDTSGKSSAGFVCAELYTSTGGGFLVYDLMFILSITPTKNNIKASPTTESA